MTCEVPWIRLTDGHAWTHKCLADRDYMQERSHERGVPDGFDPAIKPTELAKKYNVTIPMVYRWLRDTVGFKTRAQIAYELRQKGYTMREIAEKMGIHPKTAGSMVYLEKKRLLTKKLK